MSDPQQPPDHALVHVPGGAGVADLVPDLLPEVRLAARRARNAHIALCRCDGAEFNRYVLRDDETGAAIENAPAHDEWHQLFSRYRKVALWSHVESGKSSSVTVGRALFELGRNPDLRIAIVTWIERTYHRRRRQATLGRLTPIEFETIMTTPATQAA